jgi:hypothetical protein
MRGWRQREGLEDAKPVGLKMEEGSQASRTVGVSKSRNQKEVSSEPTEGTPSPRFSGPDSQNCKIIEAWCSTPLRFCYFVSAALGS